MDSVYSTRIGRRRSWILPLQVPASLGGGGGGGGGAGGGQAAKSHASICGAHAQCMLRALHRPCHTHTHHTRTPHHPPTDLQRRADAGERGVGGAPAGCGGGWGGDHAVLCACAAGSHPGHCCGWVGAHPAVTPQRGVSGWVGGAGWVSGWGGRVGGWSGVGGGVGRVGGQASERHGQRRRNPPPPRCCTLPLPVPTPHSSVSVHAPHTRAHPLTPPCHPPSSLPPCQLCIHLPDCGHEPGLLYLIHSLPSPQRP